MLAPGHPVERLHYGIGLYAVGRLPEALLHPFAGALTPELQGESLWIYRPTSGWGCADFRCVYPSLKLIKKKRASDPRGGPADAAAPLRRPEDGAPRTED